MLRIEAYRRGDYWCAELRSYRDTFHGSCLHWRMMVSVECGNTEEEAKWKVIEGLKAMTTEINQFLSEGENNANRKETNAAKEASSKEKGS